ncbi:NAD(P)-dependent oxidoreductase [Sedimentibacter sp.]|uniref:NAD-dependent epimerase/dehydratase family protein n=1 Tax=Sedimentibacter sp. TaxID=1960295 RepID=UPI0028966022|nr:NAD(P)-dependent oxidoreductase [Sedimentibacter sp.]
MNTAILTGGTGFLGNWVLRELVNNGIFVYTVVRKDSRRRERLEGIKNIEIIELDMDEIYQLPMYVKNADVFYHLAWEGGRNDFPSQIRNISCSVKAMYAACEIGVRQFVLTGSQAEYGICNAKVDENYPTNPNTAYGACKLACYNILHTLSEQLSLPLTWVRVFSVYGEGDNPNTLISYLLRCFKNNEIPMLTEGNQLWDFLYVKDAAEALYLLGEKGSSGTYNLAYGESRPLKEFFLEARNIINPNIEMNFNLELPSSNVELNANIDKIKNELGWKPITKFEYGIKKFSM